MKELIDSVLSAAEAGDMRKVKKELKKLVSFAGREAYEVLNDWQTNRVNASVDEFVKVLLGKNGLK